MRTTLTVDDDVLCAVRERARREGRSAGAVLSDLARQALTGPPPGRTEPAAEQGLARFGFVPLPSRGPVVTNTLIDRLREAETE